MVVRMAHRTAMDLTQRAIVLRENGHLEEAARLTSEALAYEIAAAEAVGRTLENEPTRSILYRSAASIAAQAGNFDQAIYLAEEGLAGWPPPRVTAELNDILTEATKKGTINDV